MKEESRSLTPCPNSEGLARSPKVSLKPHFSEPSLNDQTLEKLIIRRCSVCQTIDLGYGWLNKELTKYITIKNPHHYSDGVCSTECLMEGYKLTEFEAVEVLGYKKGGD